MLWPLAWVETIVASRRVVPAHRQGSKRAGSCMWAWVTPAGMQLHKARHWGPSASRILHKDAATMFTFATAPGRVARQVLTWPGETRASDASAQQAALRAPGARRGMGMKCAPRSHVVSPSIKLRGAGPMVCERLAMVQPPLFVARARQAEARPLNAVVRATLGAPAPCWPSASRRPQTARRSTHSSSSLLPASRRPDHEEPLVPEGAALAAAS